MIYCILLLFCITQDPIIVLYKWYCFANCNTRNGWTVKSKQYLGWKKKNILSVGHGLDPISPWLNLELVAARQNLGKNCFLVLTWPLHKITDYFIDIKCNYIQCIWHNVALCVQPEPSSPYHILHTNDGTRHTCYIVLYVKTVGTVSRIWLVSIHIKGRMHNRCPWSEYNCLTSVLP